MFVTPLNFSAWQFYLQGIVHEDADWVAQGIKYGFYLGITKGQTRSAQRNCRSAYLQPSIIDSYIKEELDAGTMAGPFSVPPFGDTHINRFGVIPKSTPGKFRLITDLSFPQGASVNDLVPDSEAEVSYAGIPEAIFMIMKLGRGCQLAKFDISRAYRLLPVHPSTRPYFGMFWRDHYYIDLAVPFGLRSAPRVFTRFADVLQVILTVRGDVANIQHYLDDFLLAGPPGSQQCRKDLDECRTICKDLGVPLAEDKTEGPASSISYLGFILDTEAQELRLPPEKLEKIRSQLNKWSSRKSCSKRELLSLIGTLQHCCQAIVLGRPFLRRLIDRASSVTELYFRVAFTSWEREDISWWIRLFCDWNGRSLFLFPKWELAPNVAIASDASGNLGCAAINGKEWFVQIWPKGVENLNIAIKELVPIVLSAHIWGHTWPRKRIVFKCDNLAVVSLLQRGSCKDRHLAFLLRELSMIAILGDFTFTAVHIPGVVNKHADALSRFKFQEFANAVPDAASTSLPIPDNLIHQLLFPPWTKSGRVF